MAAVHNPLDRTAHAYATAKELSSVSPRRMQSFQSIRHCRHWTRAGTFSKCLPRPRRIGTFESQATERAISQIEVNLLAALAESSY